MQVKTIRKITIPAKIKGSIFPPLEIQNKDFEKENNQQDK